ncbi:DUF1800 domain-containing protein [Shewanella khirikhana]|uniref:PKD/Chitinase domain-containing protein n=1 Tax=Shewanella khirikhana TaxID=1965282 RepID=A0ABN5U1H6_9GAMM|nr:DUF1800 domain-containing protein [Shewanella khirikhana]AZQ13194.1 hypothetical protein STH12_04168 [Shewanella khirikhana]
MRTISLSILTLMLAGCGGGAEGEGAAPPASGNQPPSVNIVGVDTVRQGQSLTLTASASDPDGSIASYQWQQLDGPAVSLGSGASVVLQLPGGHQQHQQYRFKVTVTDDKGASAQAEYSVDALRAMTEVEASRLLHQATMGPTYAELKAAVGIGEAEWIAQQMTLPQSSLLANIRLYGNETELNYNTNHWVDTWWRTSMEAEDQLRQRMAFALSEIFVVSTKGAGLTREPRGMANYYDMLASHAFGNFRELLEDVTLSPVMGVYLSHLGNEKADEARNIRPDENYAREVMQLFTVGLEMLSPDGTPIQGSDGRAIPTYGQDEIEGFARVFTGWNYAGTSRWVNPQKNYLSPMTAWADYHSPEQKVLLGGTVLPAGQTAEQDLSDALDNLFNHPNVGPFIGKQLIQRLVRSNPSPAYVARVSAIFDDNGAGVRGDLGAVVTAILLDDEARIVSPDDSRAGKVREPVLRTMQLWREFKAGSVSGRMLTLDMEESHGQAPLGSPSVFNFFRPDFAPAALQADGLVAPELQIANDASLIGHMNFSHLATYSRIAEKISSPGEHWILIHLSEHVDLLNNQGIDALLDRWNLLFCAGTMTDTERRILTDVYNLYLPTGALTTMGQMLFALSQAPSFATAP